MRCTSCSTVVKPIVAVDIDGTLALYHEHFTEFARDYFNSPLRRHYDGSMDFHDWLGLSLAEYRECKLAYRQGGGKRTMPAYRGAFELVRDIRRAGAEVWITTTRPYQRLDSTDPDTRFWLGRHRIEFDFLLYHDEKYSTLYQNVDPERVVCIFDELPEQCAAAAKLFGDERVLQRYATCNSGVPRHKYGTDTLTMAKRIICKKIEEWELQHGQGTSRLGREASQDLLRAGDGVGAASGVCLGGSMDDVLPSERYL